jgi:hypothetical protein
MPTPWAMDGQLAQQLLRSSPHVERDWDAEEETAPIGALGFWPRLALGTGTQAPAAVPAAPVVPAAPTAHAALALPAAMTGCGVPGVPAAPRWRPCIGRRLAGRRLPAWWPDACCLLEHGDRAGCHPVLLAGHHDYESEVPRWTAPCELSCFMAQFTCSPRCFLSQLSPADTLQSCMSSHGFGITNDTSGSLPRWTPYTAWRRRTPLGWPILAGGANVGLCGFRASAGYTTSQCPAATRARSR